MRAAEKLSIEEKIRALDARYNPENDIIPGTPSVTYTDHALLEINRALLFVVQDLQSQIDTLRIAGRSGVSE